MITGKFTYNLISISKVQLDDTNWSFPVQIVKEDTVPLVLRRNDGTRRLLKMEVRGFEEGSRFIVVFRLGSTRGPIRYLINLFLVTVTGSVTSSF